MNSDSAAFVQIDYVCLTFKEISTLRNDHCRHKLVIDTER